MRLQETDLPRSVLLTTCPGVRARDPRSTQGEEQRFHVVDGHAVGLGETGVRNAVPHAGRHQTQSRAVERGLHCADLRDDVLAVGALLEHALDAAQLTFGAAESVERVLGHVFWESHVAIVYPRRYICDTPPGIQNTMS